MAINPLYLRRQLHADRVYQSSRCENEHQVIDDSIKVFETQIAEKRKELENYDKEIAKKKAEAKTIPATVPSKELEEMLTKIRTLHALIIEAENTLERETIDDTFNLHLIKKSVKEMESILTKCHKKVASHSGT